MAQTNLSGISGAPLTYALSIYQESDMQISLCHRFTLDMPQGEAFKLFTAEGERDWVENWHPTFIHSDKPETTSAGTVWETGKNETHTLWMCIDWQPPKRVRYARVMPTARFDLVEVEVKSKGEGSVIAVTYTFTPLTDAAQAEVEATGAESFAKMIGEWHRLILG